MVSCEPYDMNLCMLRKILKKDLAKSFSFAYVTFIVLTKLAKVFFVYYSLDYD